jgi:acetyl-CoA C-acetyltransferase
LKEESSPIPVIVGVGQVNDRPADAALGLDPLELMEAALRAADADAGGGWLKRLESLAQVDQVSFRSLGDLSGPLATRLGANPRLCAKTPSAMGDSPIRLLNEAANLIGAGEIGVAAVVGAEALRTAAARTAAVDKGPPPARRTGASPYADVDHLRRYGLVAAVDVYPLYENAGRSAYGQTLAQAQQESGEIWSRFSQVAADNEGAWIRKAFPVDRILTPSPDNRWISHPYTKLMVANSSVNQGAGFIVTSLALARAAGVPEDRLVYVGRGAAAHEHDDVLARDRYDRSSGMTVSLRRALDLNALSTEDLDFVEFYSCFPCVPKMARRMIGWPAERPASVFGGLTFGGGPIGNYMSHAVVSMAQKLRRGGRHGLLFANGGFATHNHSIILSRAPVAAGTFPQDFDFQAEADALRGPIPPLVLTYLGPGTIETYSAPYERNGSIRFGAIIGRGMGGERFLAKIPGDDVRGIAFLTDGSHEPVGSRGEAVAGPDGETIWRPSL